MISAEGVIRPFDATADGTIFGDGAGVVLLKMLDRALLDGDDIKGVILGSGFCNDGQPDEKQSFIAPRDQGKSAPSERHSMKAAWIRRPSVSWSVMERALC